MDPISSSMASWSMPFPTALADTPAAAVPITPIQPEAPAVGPLYGARVINDAVDTTIAAIKAMTEAGIGGKVDQLA
jgi:hypothetical protein